jgi:hypothetical protein
MAFGGRLERPHKKGSPIASADVSMKSSRMGIKLGVWTTAFAALIALPGRLSGSAERSPQDAEDA